MRAVCIIDFLSFLGKEKEKEKGRRRTKETKTNQAQKLPCCIAHLLLNKYLCK